MIHNTPEDKAWRYGYARALADERGDEAPEPRDYGIAGHRQKELRQ